MYCDKCENYLETLNAENEKLQNRIEELEEVIADLEFRIDESHRFDLIGVDAWEANRMKTKDMKSVVEFYIPLSWCESLLIHKRINENYQEIVQENFEKDWSKETSESVEMFLKKFEKSTIFASTYVKAEKFFVQNVLDVLKGEETK